MAQLVVEVGRFEIETWIDSWPIRIIIKYQERHSEITGLMPEDINDLIYALERVRVQIEPIVAHAILPEVLATT